MPDCLEMSAERGYVVKVKAPKSQIQAHAKIFSNISSAPPKKNLDSTPRHHFALILSEAEC